MVEDTRAFNATSYYTYLKEGQLMGVRCRNCGQLSAEARPMCQSCHSRTWNGSPSAGGAS